MAGVLGILALAAATSSAAPPAAPEAPPSSAVVHLADGSQFPLVSWGLSYEFVSAASAGEMPTRSRRRDTNELRLGGRSWPLAGTRLELSYETFERLHETDSGETVKETTTRVSALSLTQNGKTSKLKPQPPDRKFLLGDEKASVVLPRTVDLRGQTVMGGTRELCLMSFSGLAECGMTPEGRVVKVEFQ